jgi:hypothetical protein
MMHTDHASRRAQQRGVPPLIVQWLQDFGEEVYDHHGAITLHFSKRSRRRLEQTVGREPIRRMSEWMNSYAVVSTDGILITVGPRWKRINH